MASPSGESKDSDKSRLDEAVVSREDKGRKQPERLPPPRATSMGIHWDGPERNDDEKYSFRSRASLLLCRPQPDDSQVTSIGRCFGGSIIEQNNDYTRDEKVAYRKTYQTPLTERTFESEPLLRKERIKVERKVSTFDKFVEERHVEAELHRGGKDVRGDLEVKDVVSIFKERNCGMNSRALESRPSKYSLTGGVPKPDLNRTPWPPKQMPYPQSRKSGQQSDRRRLHVLRTVAVLDRCDADDISVLTDDIVLHRSAGGHKPISRHDTDSVGAPGCFGIALFPQNRSSNSDTTPPTTSAPLSEIKRGSPKSVSDDRVFASGFKSVSDRKLLKLQRDLNAGLRWTVEKNTGSASVCESNAREILADLEKVPVPELSEPRRGVDSLHNELSGRRHRVRFAHPAVTAVNVRPFTTPEERPLLYFDPVELLNLEEDRANRIPGEQFECIVTPAGRSFNVAVSIPKVLARQQGQKKPTPSSHLFEV